MAKRTCTDARPCNLMTCYGCRRRQIDETTERLISVIGEEAATKYRYSEINHLAMELAPKPQPKARKASPVADADTVRDTLTALRACMSRNAARQILGALRVVELRAIGKAIDLGACSGKRKDELVEHLIDFTVQMKLDHDAVLMAGRR